MKSILAYGIRSFQKCDHFPFQKCDVFISLTLKNKKHFIILHNLELQQVFEQKDLGDILDTDLKFDERISMKSKKMPGLLNSVNFVYIDGTLFKNLFIKTPS